MYSQQRRAERYRIIYTWKVLEGLVPNCGIQPTFSDRRGREGIVPASRGKSRIQTLRDQSFQVKYVEVVEDEAKRVVKYEDVKQPHASIYTIKGKRVCKVK